MDGFLFHSPISLIIISQRESKHIADFEAAFGVKLRTSALQDVINELESSLTAEVLVNTVGEWKSITV